MLIDLCSRGNGTKQDCLSVSTSMLNNLINRAIYKIVVAVTVTLLTNNDVKHILDVYDIGLQTLY